MIRRRPVPVVSRTIAALFGLLLAASTVVLVIPFVPLDSGLQVGDLAARTQEAPNATQYESQALTEAARDEAAAAVQEVALPVDNALRDQQVERLDRYLDQVRAVRDRADLSTQQRLDQIGNIATPEPLSNEGRTLLQLMDRAAFDQFETIAVQALREILSRPVRKADFAARADEYRFAPRQPALTDIQGPALSETLKAFATESFRVDEARTEQLRGDARANVPPVIRTFSEGQVVVTEGQRLAAADIEALEATGVIHDGFDFWAIAGGALFALALGVLLGVYVYLVQPFPAPPGRRMVLVAISMTAVLAGVRVALPLVTPDIGQQYYAFAIPVATAGMIAASFADISFAAVVAVATGLFAAFIGATGPDLAGASYVGSLQSLELGIAYTAGGLAGAAAVYRAERLSRYAFAAVAVAFATGAVMAAFWLISTPRSNVELAWIGGAAAFHGAAAAVLSVGVFVLLSLALGVTTRLQLLELGQADHPLLRRLQDEAPGTYHHSMLVGALAERGASHIHADALLVRVGAYYHDIGKLAQPTYYIENMLDGSPSPHDSLEPQASAQVIRDHVTNGLDLARKYRLPSVVRDFIPQHHGTRLVTFFYRQAAKQGDGIDAAAYRYAGPRPQSKEAAVVMLADSCEAIVRARQDEGGPTIDALVDSIFAERLAEGQLDECDITMRELQDVAASFKATLRAVYHPRVQYPSPTPEEIAGLARGDGPLPASNPAPR